MEYWSDGVVLPRKMLRWRRRERLFEPTLRGCSSVVEHLLAKEFSHGVLMFADQRTFERWIHEGAQPNP
jgi:hypothetical protein